MLTRTAESEKPPLLEAVPPKIYTVSEITSRIRRLLESEVGQVWVEGEISNLRIPVSGHCYFSLKDERSQIRAVLWRSQHRALRFELKDGLHVVLRGSLSAYEPRSEYQIIADWVEPKGLGALQLAFEQLKERLEKEGLFDPKNKKPIPILPRRVGVVTSPTGAAIRDILNVLHRRFANVAVTVVPVRVQGEGAAEEIALAIRDLNRWGRVDVIIAGRGGGSLEDLWPFNEEVVARAIFDSKIPIVSAVGHEVDFTIADFVADLRAPTPSAAAELVVQNKVELMNQIEGYRIRLRQTIQSQIERKRSEFLHWARAIWSPERLILDYVRRVDDLRQRLELIVPQNLHQKRERVVALEQMLHHLSPLRRMAEVKRSLQEGSRRLIRAVQQRIDHSRERVKGIAVALQALSPLAVLERGYSIVWGAASGKIVKSAKEVDRGEEIQIRLRRGELHARVDQKVEEE